MLQGFLIATLVLGGTGLALFLVLRLLGFLLRSLWAMLCAPFHATEPKARDWVSSRPAFPHRPFGSGVGTFPDDAPNAFGSRYPSDWAGRRAEAMRRAGFHCDLCGRDLQHEQRNREVHHRRRFGTGEHALGNLQLLCRDCHANQPGPAWIRAKRELRLDGMGRIHLAACPIGKVVGWAGAPFRDTLSRACRNHEDASPCVFCFGGRSPQEVDALQAA